MCATGTEALRGAAYAVASGAVDVALAVGVEKLKDTKKVDLYQFIIHLYIQQFYSIDLKSSVLSKEE
jgi:acetyl-CoA acetyltransferase